MVRKLISIGLAIELLIVNAVPVFAQPNFKLPWGRSLKNIRLNSGPHARGNYDPSDCDQLLTSRLVALDFSLSRNTKVLTTAAGKVVAAGEEKLGGKYVIIDHGNGWKTRYYHLNKILVKKNDYVVQGFVIGKSGKTGIGASSYHLHFEIYPKVDGVVIDGYKIHAVKVAGETSKSFNYMGTLTKGSETVAAVFGQCSRNKKGEVKTFGSSVTADAERNDYLYSTNRKVSGGSCRFAPGENSSRRGLFQQAYDRNGGWGKMGCAQGPTYWWKGMVRQDFPGKGTFGPAVILHDEPADKPKLSLPAYVVHGGIWKYYRNNPVFGPPVSDEYKNAFKRPQSDFRDGFVYWGSPARARRYFLKGSSSTIYLIVSGRKYPTPNAQTRSAMRYPGAVSSVSNSELALFPTGSQISNVDKFWLAQYFDNPITYRPAKVLAGGGGGWFETHWGSGSPASSIPADNFSSRFTRRFPFNSGTYNFSVNSDDGVRLWVGNQLVIDDWVPKAGNRTAQAYLGKGVHTLRLEQFEKAGSASVGIRWLSDQWSWMDTGTDETLDLDLSSVEGGGVRMVLNGRGGSGGWKAPVWAAKDTSDVAVTPDLRVYWEQMDKAHSLHFGMVVQGKDGKDYLLVYSANATNKWGLKGWVDMGGEGFGYGAWKDISRNVSEDFRQEYGLEAKVIKELRVGHFVKDSWVGDRGGSVRNIAFDLSAPQTQASVSPSASDGDNGWYRSAPTVNLSAKDDASGVDRIEYNLGFGWQVYSKPFTLSKDGKISIKYRAVDKAGRIEAAKRTTLNVDTTPPSSSLQNINPYQNSLPFPIPVSASDNSGVSRISIYRRKAGDSEWQHHWTSPSGSVPLAFNIETLAEGEWAFVSRATDVAGNKEKLPEKADISLVFDKTPPKTDLSYEGPVFEGEEGQTFISPETQIELTADDTNPVDPAVKVSGVAQTNYQIDEDEEQTYEEKFSIEGEDGKYEIRYQSDDVAGNEEPQNTQEVYLDGTAPESRDDSDGEWHNEDVTVTITSDDREGSGVQKIIYTGDQKGEEVRSHTEVTFEAEGIHTLSYRAVDNVGNFEEEKMADPVKIDKTAPRTTAVIEPDKPDGESGWYRSDVEVTLGVTDENLDNSEVETSGVKQTNVSVNNHHHTLKYDSNEDRGALPLFEEDGIYGVEFYSEDWAGNVEDFQNIEVKRDATPPVIYGKWTEEPNENGWYNEDISVQFEATDETSGVAFVTEEQVIKTEGADQSVAGVAVDVAGNNSTTVVGGINIDKTNPDSMLEPLDPYYNNDPLADDPIELVYASSDELSGVERVRLYQRRSDGDWEYHGGSSRKPPDPFQVGTLEEGRWEFVSVAVDYAGNVGGKNDAKAVSMVYDITSPITTASVLGDEGSAGWYTSPAVLQLFADDSKSGIEVSGVSQTWLLVGEGGQEDYHTLKYDSESPPIFDDGSYTVEFWSVDRAGNVGAAEVILLDVDTTIPASAITSLEEGVYYNAQTWVGILGTAEDNLSGVTQVEVRVDKDGEEGEWMRARDTEAWSFDFTPEDGYYTVYSRSTDQAGNQESTSQVSFTYDATPPVTSVKVLGSKGLNGWYISPVTLNFSAVDDTSGVLDTWVMVVNSQDDHYYTLKDGLAYRQTYFASGEYDSTGSDGYRIQYGGGDPLVLEDGSYTVEFWSVDLAGNEGEHQILSFKIDAVAPQVPIPSVLGGTFIEGEVLRVSFTVGENTEIYHSLNNGDFVLYSNPITITDDVTLSAYTVDEAGNQSSLISWGFTFVPRPDPDDGGQVLGVLAEGEEEVEKGSGYQEGESDGEVKGATASSGSSRTSSGYLIVGVILLGAGVYLIRRRMVGWRC